MGHGKLTDMDVNNVGKISKRYFLPHHCAVRDKNTTKQLRVIFDASMKSFSGLFPNDVMLKGFTIDSVLFHILFHMNIYFVCNNIDIIVLYIVLKHDIVLKRSGHVLVFGFHLGLLFALGRSILPLDVSTRSCTMCPVPVPFSCVDFLLLRGCFVNSLHY